MDLTVLYQLSYGVYIVGANDGGRPTGCVINTCMQITSSPQTIAISLNKENYTYDVIRRTNQFSVSILSEETPAKIISVFGYTSGRDKNKFEGCRYRLEGKLPIVEENCCGHLLCDVLSMTDMGTHVVIFAKLSNTVQGAALPPMTYAYYHRVLKGKAPKNAPTYQAEAATPSEREAYVCSICGYVYEGDISKEPEDYVCPVCGAPKNLFEKK